MKCDLVKEKIDKLIFDKNDRDNLEVSIHITSCTTCKAYYEENIRAKNIMELLRRKPDLKNPLNLTNNIIDAINLPDDEEYRNLKKLNNGRKTFMLIQRILVAASVCLLMIFGYEQYVVVNKVFNLEQKMSSVPKGLTYSQSYKNVIRYYPKQAIELAKTKFDSQVFKLQNSNFKTLITLARLSSLDLKGSEQQLQYQLRNPTILNENESKDKAVHDNNKNTNR
ncbi:MAG: hypothetical protein K8R68_04015 [Bacteroidales bacterium]|nr:hypothetical protein [Bacteroidales bacterium]